MQGGTTEMILGIVINPHAMSVPTSLIEAARRFPVKVRTIHLPSLVVSLDKKGKAIVTDKDGIVSVDCLAPYLLFGYPAAVTALRIVSSRAFSQNSVDSVLLVDDKAATAERLGAAGVPQVPTIICPADIDLVHPIAAKVGYPVVLKRTHGAYGMWVRNAADEVSLRGAFDELMEEGPGALVIQPQIIEVNGKSVRAVVTGGKILAVTQRIAKDGDWRSNISRGAIQHPVDLDEKEHKMVLAATEAIGLQHSGIDLLQTAKGSVVLEVNGCPGFTSMIPYFPDNLADAVVQASLGKKL